MPDLSCRPDIDDAGLPGRTPAMVQRDERMYPMRVDQIAGAGRHEPDPSATLAHADLLAGLASDSTVPAIGAAFVAGRCTTDDASGDSRTSAALAALVDSFNPASLRNRANVYVEAVMSTALLGAVDDAHQRLLDLVTVPDNASIAGYLAAGYLAQFGDASGYPLLRSDLDDRSNPHGRNVALRQLVAFCAVDGQKVGSIVVDVRRDLLALLRDKDAQLAAEVPGLLVESGLTDVRGDLEAATKRPFPKAVRELAADALGQLEQR